MADSTSPKRKIRRVVKTPGRGTRVVNVGPKPATNTSRWSRFTHIMDPRNFREEWVSRAGLIRLGKIAGIGFLGVVLIFVIIGSSLPSPNKINARVSAQTTKFYDRTGNTVIYEVFGDQNRSIVTFDQMSPNIKNATIAVEDKNFYKHGAFSSIGLLRAATTDVLHRGSGLQGGSTITQQYVKKALLTDDQTFTRKAKELVLSLEIEQLYKKDDILKLYLNEIPYGSQAYGIQAASKTYFGKDAKDLTLDEAAMLAAIPQAPTYYSPYGQHRDALIARQRLILDLMADQHYITKDQAEAAKAVDVLAKVPPTQNLYANIIAPHFVLDVQEQLEAKYGSRTVNEGGFKIITTLDLDKQKMAEAAIAKNIKAVRSYGGSNSAMAVSDPKTGQMLAMVGSYDFNDPTYGAYNVATADRQPGSSFKPIVYATAMKKNYGAGTTLYDVTTDFGNGYKPKNYSGQTYGVQSMRTSLANSLNIPSVKMLYLAGIPESLNTAHEMGISTLKDGADQYGLSLVLGSGEVKLVDMVNAYGTFANGGTNVPQSYVLKMTDPKGNVKEEYKQPTPKRVLDPQIAYIISSMLSDNEARKLVFGNYSPLIVPGHAAAVKTGTTEDYKDAWTVGYTPSLVAGVWSGNNNNTPMTKSASAVSAPIWHDFMTAALAGKSDEPFNKPEGIKSITLDADTGKLPGAGTKNTRTDIFPSWYKPASATDSTSGKVDKVSGKLATDCTPPAAVQLVYSSQVHAEIPSNDPAYSRWEPPVAGLAQSLGYNSGGGILPVGNDDVHNCSDQKPTTNLTVTDLGSGNYKIAAGYTSGTFPANKLEFYWDDQLISTQALSGGANTYSLNHVATSNGGHTVKVVVTDGGLYQADDSQAVTVTGAGGGGGFSATSPTTDQAAGVVPFQWSSFAGATKYILYVKRKSNNGNVGGSPAQVPAPSTSMNLLLAAGDYYWFVEAYNGGTLLDTSKPNPVYFTVN